MASIITRQVFSRQVTVIRRQVKRNGYPSAYKTIFQDKTIVLIYESDEIDRNAKDDHIATSTLTKWISKDQTIKISENKGLISRIANIPLILC